MVLAEGAGLQMHATSVASAADPLEWTQYRCRSAGSHSNDKLQTSGKQYSRIVTSVSEMCMCSCKCARLQMPLQALFYTLT